MTPLPHLLFALAQATRAHPLDRKLLLCGSPAQGREWLHALAHAGTPWIGWEPVSLRQLAYELAGPAMAEMGLGAADEFDVLALVDEAIDAVAERGDSFARVISAPGFREAAQAAVQALRGAGVVPEHLEEVRGGNAKLAVLAAVLREFERALARAEREDGAGVFRWALEALDSGAARLPDALLFVVPGLELGGWSGRLLRRLLDGGRARVLPGDPVVGLDAPPGVLWPEADGAVPEYLSYLHAPELLPDLAPRPLHLFAAATPADELREVLRRVLERDLPLDQVEVIATDPFTYGPAMDTLARRLGVPVTHAAGLPSERTRVGRVVRAYFQWISDGFPADRLRRLLEAGDLAARDAGVSSAALGRRLRRLRIGWGRERYLEALERGLEAADQHRPAGEDGDAAEAEWARERELRELRALHEMLFTVMAAAPPAPERAGRQGVRTSPSAVAAGLLALLEYVPPGDEVENVARAEVRRRLQRVRQTLTRETGWESAVAILRSRLGFRVAVQDGGEMGSWNSRGGRIHFTDLSSGGLCNRPHTFVVGLDSTRAARAGGVDPLLSDEERGRLNAVLGGGVPALPTAGERIAQGRHQLAAALARLRGEVTLSFSAWDAAEGRAVSPAAELLQALRLRERDPFLTYDGLRRALGPLACAVPQGDACLDASDVWMRALAADGGPRDGRALVRDAFAGLAGGLRAQEVRGGDAFTPHHGRISREVAEEMVREMVFSPSRLEALGSCPRKFLYRYLLRLQPTGDPEWDPEAWLDALERGTLLHAVYEHTLERARERALDFADEAFEALALRTLEAEVQRARHRVPPPTERVFELEVEQLRADVRLFVRMVRETQPRWRELEYEFGTRERPVRVELGGREVRLQGKIDRVDEVGPDRLRVIDYKTGSARRYQRSRPFAGGRRIQHVVYLLAAEQLLEGMPAAMEYHFPTTRGENEAVRYTSEQLASGRDALRSLLDLAFTGLFVATEDANDCRYCDYRTICRVREDDWGRVACAEVDWSKDVGMGLADYQALQFVRGLDDA